MRASEVLENLLEAEIKHFLTFGKAGTGTGGFNSEHWA